MSSRTGTATCALIMFSLLCLPLLSTPSRERAYQDKVRVKFVMKVYKTTYGREMEAKRAKEIVGWCHCAANCYGLSVDWLLALAARERAFLNTRSARKNDGAGYMQMTPGRARLLDPTLRTMTDNALEEYLVLNPDRNIMLSAKFLKQLEGKSASWRDAMCKFNVGENGNLNGKAAREHWAAVERYHNALVRSFIN